MAYDEQTQALGLWSIVVTRWLMVYGLEIGIESQSESASEVFTLEI